MKFHFRTFPKQLRSELKRDVEMLERQGVLQRGIHGNITGKTRECSTCLLRCNVQLCTQRRWPLVSLET